MDVGFIGLGSMGGAMALRLVEAGHRVRAWNRSPEPAEALARKGAMRIGSPHEAFAGDAAVTMLANDEAVRSVLLEGGAMADAPGGLVHIVMATISVDLARELEGVHAERGIVYVAAPVLGRPDVAAQGKIHILAAGDPAALARVQPLLDVMGQKTWRLGDTPHTANVVKICANLLLASAIEAMAEAITLARQHEVDPHRMMGALTGSLFSAPVYQTYGDVILNRKFEPALFKARLGLKDVKLAMAAGDDAGVPLPIASLVHDSLLDAIAHGHENDDWAVLATAAARRAGVDGAR
jgi:3-hydroxyisobutyrate dehydrogenase-like beta-hydroxyacid dehydrogenase